ncbi:MAG: 2-C-methyl-D-erythritol 4-phosphate cytidylyltransferase [Candidatus Nanopelagicales bacterium]
MTSNYGDRSLRSVAIVIAAAGRGERLGGELPKALEHVAGVSLLEYCVHTVAALRGLGAVVVSAPEAYLAEVDEICARLTKPAAIVVPGGSTRTESVANALAMLPDDIDIVLVHDAARAFTPVEQFLDVIAAVEAGSDAVIPGLAVVDTTKEVDGDGFVVRTVPRDSLRGVQTPQGFRRETLDAVHRDHDLRGATDDAGMVEASGGHVKVIPGHPDAFKVTTPFDRLIGDALVTSRSLPH